MSMVLDGIRVVELAEALAGPYCAMLLGDLGADVIKVERNAGGDQSQQTIHRSELRPSPGWRNFTAFALHRGRFYLQSTIHDFAAAPGNRSGNVKSKKS